MTHKKRIGLFALVFSLFFVVSMVVGGDWANAQEFSPNIFVRFFVWVLLSVTAFFLKLSMWALSFIITIGAYNGYLDSKAVEIGWVMVRDITNMFFVIILLLVAFGTILGLEQYEWKKMLVKFFFAAVLVNFSRVICGVIIDVAQVIMITFINGIAATASGNLITAFGLSDINTLAVNAQKPSEMNNEYEIMTGALGGLIFSAITLAMMLVFVFMLLARMLVLWVLIILSPVAFVLSVVPQTQKYASQWWSEFGNHVIVGPIVVFFIWLSFAVIGGGNISKEVSDASLAPAAQKDNSTESATVTESFKFNNISTFAIGIGILLVGAKVSQSLGTVGGSAMSKATDFGKKVAMVGSGLAAGMWAGKKLKQGAGAALKGAGKLAYMGTLENTVDRLKLFAQRQVEGYRAFRAGIIKPIMEEVEETDKEGKVVIDPNTGKAKKVLKQKQKLNAKTGEMEPEWEQRKGPISWIGRGYRKKLEGEKKLEKVKGMTKTREDLIRARAGVIPNYWAQKLEGPQIKDIERMEQGQLAAEKERSAAKTAEFEAMGKESILASGRFRAGIQQKATVAEQIARHKERAGATEESIKALLAEAKTNYMESGAGAQTLTAKVAASVKIARDESHQKATEGRARRTFIRKDILGQRLLAEKSRWDARQKRGEAITKMVETKAQAEFAQSVEGKEFLQQQKSAEMGEAVGKGLIAQEEAEAEKRFKATQPGAELVAALNLSEQAKLAAENFIKTLKEKDLQGSFEKSAERMREILKIKDKKEMAKQLAKAEKEDAYIRAMTEGQRLKTSTDASSIRKKQAEQAAKNVAISKPKYGTTTASTALSEYSEGKMKEYRQLERAAAMRKATEVYVELMAQKDAYQNGEEGAKDLDIDQEAELFAASSLLSEEAWKDDQHDYVTSKLEDLKAGKLEGDEKAKWEIAAKNFGKLGWLGDNAMNGEIKDANGKYNFKVDRNYDRRSAADLQNLATSGMDVDLVVAHKKVAAVKEENKHLQEEAVAKTTDDYLSLAMKDQTLLNRASVKTKIDTARQSATTTAASMNLSGDDAAKYVTEAVKTATEAAILAEKDVAKELNKWIVKATKNITVDYWKLADQILPTAGVAGLKNAKDLEERYARSEDFMQDAVKSNKKNAINTGHEELGYNQDFDSDRGVYRFTTFSEGQASMRAERVKQKRQQLISTDQYHSNGILAQKQGIIDDFNEDAITVSTGGVTKDIELNSIPERSLKGAYYIHKNESAQVVTGKGGKRYAVVGGAAALEKFAEDGHTSQSDIQQHMLTRGILASLMAGEVGYSLVGRKNYQHVTEAEAQAGVINQDIAGLQVSTLKELAEVMLSRIQVAKQQGKNYLAGSKYANQTVRVEKKLKQIMNSVYRAASDRNTKGNAESVSDTSTDDAAILPGGGGV